VNLDLHQVMEIILPKEKRIFLSLTTFNFNAITDQPKLLLKAHKPKKINRK
jgi:hypothetical protein